MSSGFNRKISRFGEQHWSPRSGDLTRLDYVICEYLKSKVYVYHPKTFHDFKGKIELNICEIQSCELENI